MLGGCRSHHHLEDDEGEDAGHDAGEDVVEEDAPPASDFLHRARWPGLEDVEEAKEDKGRVDV